MKGETIKHCHKCGKKNKEGAKFCRICGVELKKTRKDEEREEKEQEKKKDDFYKKIRSPKLIIPLIIIILSLLIIFIPTKTVSYTVSVPYTVQVPYQEQESYTDYRYEVKEEVVYERDCDKKSNCVCNALGRDWIIAGTCKICNCDSEIKIPVTRYRTVTKYRSVTEYRTETRYKTVNWLFG